MQPKKGASTIVAVDITEEAINNTLLNLTNYGHEHKTDLRISNVFSAISPNEKFDLIFWNVHH